jgi:hypothetical protein
VTTQTVLHRSTLIFAFLLVLAGLLILADAPAHGQSGSFIIAQHGKPVGTAEVTFAAASQGYDSTSVVRLAMQGLNYNISKTEHLTSSNHLKHVQLSATVNNSAVNVVATRDEAHFLINISANGRSTTTRLDSHPAAVFLPDFDPGAYDTLLALAVNYGNRGLWAIIPKETGSIVPIQLATYADEHGTRDGKPITVHHLKATFDGATTDLFSGPENQLLQAEFPQQGFAVVRRGFVLTPPAKPGAPPAAQPGAQAPPASSAPLAQ